MKEALAIILLVILVAFGWKQSYQSHIQHFLGEAVAPPAAKRFATPVVTAGAPASASQTPLVAPTPAPDRSWIFGPRAMDKSYDQQRSR